VTEHNGRDYGSAYMNRYARFDCGVFNPGIQLRFPYRKKTVLQLYGKRPVDGFIGDRVNSAVDFNVIVRDKNGDEERQALYMIPMGVGNENMRLDGHFFQQVLCKRVDAGAGVKNDQIIVIGPDFYTGGIAAVFNGAGSRCGYGSSNAPEFDFHCCPSTAWM
jgi:hypothetical protein